MRVRTTCPPVEPIARALVLRQWPRQGLISQQSQDRGFAVLQRLAYAAFRGTKATTTSASKTAAMRRSNGRECRL
jgi:hypothetical protein